MNKLNQIKQENMHIAFGINDAYVMPCGVLITSILRQSEDVCITFHILTDFLSAKNMYLLEKCCEGYDCKIEFHKIERFELVKKFPEWRGCVATYYRLLLPELLPDISKVLYLDSDMLVVDSLRPLWNTDIENSSVAVAIFNNFDQISYLNNLDLERDAGYFNAGMLLINLDYWRKNSIQQQALNFINEYPDKLIFADQEPLNFVLARTKKIVSYRYNMTTFTKVNRLEVRKEYWEDIIDAQKSPAIIHFVWQKPWEKHKNEHPYQKVWYSVKNTSIWKNKQFPSDKPLYKKIIKAFVPYGIIAWKEKLDYK